MRLFWLWLLSGTTIFIGSMYSTRIRADSFGVSLVAALVLGLVNITIRPLLLFFTLPLNIITLGLFTFFINALMILLVARLVPRFQVGGFGPALVLSLILGVLSTLILET